MSQVTPGNWSYARATQADRLDPFAEKHAVLSDIHASDGFSGVVLAECFPDIRAHDERNVAECAANAKLFASAKRLLQLAKDLHEYAVREDGSHFSHNRFGTMLHEAAVLFAELS